MELDKAGHWRTLQFLRTKHQLFVISLNSYRPAARIKLSQKKSLPPEVRKLVYLCGKDLDNAAELLKDASESGRLLCICLPVLRGSSAWMGNSGAIMMYTCIMLTL